MLILLVCGSHFEKQKSRTNSKLIPLYSSEMFSSKWYLRVLCVCVCTHARSHACVKLVMMTGAFRCLLKAWPGSGELHMESTACGIPVPCTKQWHFILVKACKFCTGCSVALLMFLFPLKSQ